jgi:FAD synthase
MQVFHKLADVPGDFGPAIVSVGNFDGVHRAHRSVLGEIVGRAKTRHAKSMAVTFEPHPVRILRPDQNLRLLTPTPEKLRLLADTGIDAVMLLPFSRDLSLMTPHGFAHDILRERLHACEVHEGYNFHFGHKASGNIRTLRELGRRWVSKFTIIEMRLRGNRFRAATSANYFAGAASAGPGICASVQYFVDCRHGPRLRIEIHRSDH